MKLLIKMIVIIIKYCLLINKKISLRSALQSIIIHENDCDNNNNSKEDSVQPIDSKQYTSYNSRDEVKISS